MRVLPTQVHVSGRPLLDVDFDDVPSRNRQQGWRGHMGKVAEWRYEARCKAMAQRGLDEDDFLLALMEPMVKGRALVLVTVYVRNMGKSDITNPDLKPMLDGFTDAGVWADDEWAWVPVVLYTWGGISETGKNRVNIKVYELHAYYLMGEEQALPEGRVRL